LRYALLASLLVLSTPTFADGPPRDPYIQVNGHGELKVAPDIAYVSLSIEKTAADAKAARADVEARTAKVITLARKLGIADRDIEAPAVTVYPEYQCVTSSLSSGCTNKLVGQHVSRAVTLTLRDLSRYGDLADGLFAAGVTDLGAVDLDRSDRRTLEEKARALAVQDAYGKAAGLAKAAGADLGAVFSITEQGGGYNGPRPVAMAMAKSSDEAQPEYLNGKIDIAADVAVYYLIGK
jgi:hypothetical protein